eukprot:6213287-Pleurochrysis_carterae.AAC.2
MDDDRLTTRRHLQGESIPDKQKAEIALSKVSCSSWALPMSLQSCNLSCRATRQADSRLILQMRLPS